MGIKIINPVFEQRKERVEKLHYFPYRDQYYIKEKERENNLTVKLAVDEEFRLLGKLGVRKKDDMTNYSLLKNFGNIIMFFNIFAYQVILFYRLKNLSLGGNGMKTFSDLNHRGLNDYKRHDQLYGKEGKWENIKTERDNFKTDYNYVKSLNNWEKQFLPKIAK